MVCCRYVVDLEERVNFLENQHDLLLAGFNEELQAMEVQKSTELARLEEQLLKAQGGGGDSSQVPFQP